MNIKVNEGKLISGKEALIALANGEDVQWSVGNGHWIDATHENSIELYLDADGAYGFRLKPRTITINGIEVPAPFEPKDGEECCYLSDESIDGYHTIHYNPDRYRGMAFGLYRPFDVKQVIAALRQVFGGSHE